MGLGQLRDTVLPLCCDPAQDDCCPTGSRRTGQRASLPVALHEVRKPESRDQAPLVGRAHTGSRAGSGSGLVRKLPDQHREVRAHPCGSDLKLRQPEIARQRGVGPEPKLRSTDPPYFDARFAWIFRRP